MSKMHEADSGQKAAMGQNRRSAIGEGFARVASLTKKRVWRNSA
jgi:hypothetical protein